LRGFSPFDSTRSFYFALQQLFGLVNVERRLPGVAVSLARNVDLLRLLPMADGLRLAEFGRSADSSSPLEEVTGFGDNPGNLRMFAFVPAQLQKPRALVVVLHGCGQTASGYDLGAGWSTLAER